MTTTWRSHPIMKSWMSQVRAAGYCTPEDIELLREALRLPKYQMGDFLSNELLPSFKKEGIKYRNRRLASGEYAQAAVKKLPSSDLPLDLPSTVRTSSTMAKGRAAGPTAPETPKPDLQQRLLKVQEADERRSTFSEKALSVVGLVSLLLIVGSILAIIVTAALYYRPKTEESIYERANRLGTTPSELKKLDEQFGQ